MNRHGYDTERAGRLVPLLRAITSEIRERSAAIETLEREAAQLPRTRHSAERRAQIEADLSMHRRETRTARRDLERLGCTLDADHPLRVLIPGADGDLGSGWAWDPIDGTLRSLALAPR
jgi:hypothetical protein